MCKREVDEVFDLMALHVAFFPNRIQSDVFWRPGGEGKNMPPETAAETTTTWGRRREGEEVFLVFRYPRLVLAPPF